jgi:hypothetical protein
MTWKAAERVERDFERAAGDAPASLSDVNRFTGPHCLNDVREGPSLTRMLRFFRRRIVALLAALGLCLGGAVPAWAGPAAPIPCMMMAGMPMPPSPETAQKRMPTKNMPCDGTGCGCCVAGICAMPSLMMEEAIPARLLHSEKIAFHNMRADGLSHPPALPPPILHA